MARQISAEKQQMFLNEDVRTLLPRMAVPTIVAQLIAANTITDTASIERRSKRTPGTKFGSRRSSVCQKTTQTPPFLVK